MPIFSGDIYSWFLSNKHIPRRDNMFFSDNLSTGTDLAFNFDKVECITQNKYSYQNYNGKVEGGLSPKR